ncbi:MAG: aldo/keto reductase [Actinomycetota bacterium]|nr:aldo/keto reductase [Actinomycetota bacterium]
MTLPQRTIGDLSVSAIGLGCMPMSFETMLDDRERAIATIHRALDLGINLLDTANIYAPAWDAVGHNEALVAEAVRTYQGEADLTDLLVTTKGGITRGPGESWGRDSSAAALRSAAEDSLTRLGVEVIELYQHHRHDPSQTYPDQVRALAALKDAGLIRRIGLSNVNGGELAVALDILGGPADGGVVSVQNEFSPRYRDDEDVLERCTGLGIAFLPWSPLGGSDQAHDVGSHYTAFAEVGVELGASAQEVVLAWLLRLSPVMIPIPGATRPATVESCVRAVSLSLSEEQFGRLQATAPVHGSMYADDLPRSPLA